MRSQISRLACAPAAPLVGGVLTVAVASALAGVAPLELAKGIFSGEMTGLLIFPMAGLIWSGLKYSERAAYRRVARSRLTRAGQ